MYLSFKYFVILTHSCLRVHLEIVVRVYDTSKSRKVIQNIGSRVVCNVLINIFPSDIFQTLLTSERYHQNCQTDFGRFKHLWVRLCPKLCLKPHAIHTTLFSPYQRLIIQRRSTSTRLVHMSMARRIYK